MDNVYIPNVEEHGLQEFELVFVYQGKYGPHADDLKSLVLSNEILHFVPAKFGLLLHYFHESSWYIEQWEADEGVECPWEAVVSLAFILDVEH